MASPGANLASGYVEQMRQKALECERDNILSRFRGNIEVCCVPPAVRGDIGAVYRTVPLGSELTKKADACAQEQARVGVLDGTFPKVALSSGAYTQRTRDNALTAVCNAFNPDERFAAYKRFEPPVPCPAPTTEQLNSTQPPAWMPAAICQPSRYN